MVHFGSYATAEEAALRYARSPEGMAAAAAAAAAPPMTAEEAVRQAEAVGLTLVKADNFSGYLGVRCYSSRRNLTKSYEAIGPRGGGKTKSLGYFATAEEAALCRARLLDWEGVESFYTNMYM